MATLHAKLDQAMRECIEAIPFNIGGSADIAMADRCEQKFGRAAKDAGEAHARIECRLNPDSMNRPVNDPMGDTTTGDVENVADLIAPVEPKIIPPQPMPYEARPKTPAAAPADTPTGTVSGASPASVQSQADADIAACARVTSQAQSCCANPRSCGTVTASEEEGSRGMKSCKQMARLAEVTSEIYNQMGAICSSNVNSCQTACAPLVQKYSNLANGSGQPAILAIYQTTLGALNGKLSACNAESSTVSMYRRQATEGAIAAGRSDSCKTATADKEEEDDDSGLQTSGLGGLGDIFGKSSDTPSVSKKEKESENKPTVEAAKEIQRAQEAGAFVAPSKSIQAKDFNVDDPPLAADSYVSSIAPGAGGGEAPTVTPPPNNTGGAIPNANPVATATAASKSSSGTAFFPSKADIFPGGFMPGGYTMSHPGEAPDASAGRRYRPQNFSAGRKKDQFNNYVGMDLKRFLPGESLDPNRRLAGVQGPGVEINGKGADVWNKITEKMTERCRLGLLWKCQP